MSVVTGADLSGWAAVGGWRAGQGSQLRRRRRRGRSPGSDPQATVAAAAATLLQQRTGLELMGINPAAAAAATLLQQRTRLELMAINRLDLKTLIARRDL